MRLCCDFVSTSTAKNPKFEGTATADLLEAWAFIANWLKPSLLYDSCMIDQVLLSRIFNKVSRFHRCHLGSRIRLQASSAALSLRAGRTSLHPFPFPCIDRSAQSYHQYSTTPLLYIVHQGENLPAERPAGKHPLSAIVKVTIHRHIPIRYIIVFDNDHCAYFKKRLITSICILLFQQ